MKNYITLCLMCCSLAACQKKDSNTAVTPATQPKAAMPVETTPPASTGGIRPFALYFKGDFHVVTPMPTDSNYRNTIFSVRDITADSFVIATADYLQYRLWCASGLKTDSIIYGFKKNNTGNYYRHFSNDYWVSLQFVKDSAYLHIWQQVACPDYATGDFAGVCRR